MTTLSNLAFIFPGQGSQALAMLSDFASNDVVQETFSEGSEVLGINLWQLAQEGPASEMNKTENTQPLLLTASVALWRAWQAENGAQPAVMAGHSLGEYSALVCAGALSFADGVNLVRNRGRYMQAAVAEGEGKMAAIIGLDDASIIEACAQAEEGEVVAAVNFNSPGQVVIAGQASAVERAMVLCKEKGAKRALPLPVSVPSHCALMKSAADQLAIDLAALDVVTPVIDVINNVDVKAESDPQAIKDALIRQLYCPVRWTECVEKIAASGVDTLVECGPGNVLSGLNRRINRALNSAQINKNDLLNQLVSELS